MPFPRSIIHGSLALFLALSLAPVVTAHDAAADFEADVTTAAKPWTHLEFENDPDNFQFAVVSDRTGSPRAGVFQDAIKKLNWMMPEFVISVGDLIQGTSANAETNDAEWDEMMSWIEPLKMPFFFAAGNHDIQMKWLEDRVQPEDMLAQWNERFGTTHYSFVYKNVLFVVLFTNDNKEQYIGEEQVAYFEQTMAEHTDVRWTFVLLHHPLWVYPHESNFSRIETALQGRQHTVLAGHHHRYVHFDRNDNDYIILASTGGGSKLRGQAFGEFDHISWFTMTEDGPVMANLELSGIMPKDVATETSFKHMKALEQSADIQTNLILDTTDGGAISGGSVYVKVTNRSDQTLRVSGQFQHSHAVHPNPGLIDVRLAGFETQVVEVVLNIMAPISVTDVALLELDLTSLLAKHEDLAINQTLSISLQPDESNLLPSEELVFVDEMHPALSFDRDDRVIRYTTDGSEPTAASTRVQGPLHFTQSTNLKARIFTRGGVPGPVDSMRLAKVPAGAGLLARYFEHDNSEGHVNQMPLFAGFPPTLSKPVTNFGLSQIARREEDFAVIFAGWLEITEAGNYGFHVESADGVLLTINGKNVVDDQIKHPRRETSGFAQLGVGRHAIELHFFQANRDSFLQIDYTTPSGQRRAIPDAALSFDANTSLNFSDRD